MAVMLIAARELAAYENPLAKSETDLKAFP
jgi:hypothetical protein